MKYFMLGSATLSAPAPGDPDWLTSLRARSISELDSGVDNLPEIGCFDSVNSPFPVSRPLHNGGLWHCGNQIIESFRLQYLRLLKDIPAMTGSAIIFILPGCFFAPSCPYAFDQCQELTPGHRVACHLYSHQQVIGPAKAIT